MSNMGYTFVIFGASGDLTSRKLIPALYNLYRKGRLGDDLAVYGVSRSEFSDDDWRTSLKETTAKFAGARFHEDAWNEFAQHVFYIAADATKTEEMVSLKAQLDEKEADAARTRIYYLSMSPKLYEQTICNMGVAGMSDESDGARRIVIEKPFGTDLATSQQLNHCAHQVFQEDQIYRIDHYLGKETVQNLMVLRFANSIFEPIWNRNYVDHVQITVAEEVVIGRRAGYYDHSGILRDMFQNHILQLMTITAMEAPAKYEANSVRDEKVKVLKSVRPISPDQIGNETVRAQYMGYLKEEGVPKGSQTATFAALRLCIDNWRWQGVPFYLRSGKGLSCRTSQIVVQFRQPPHLLFNRKRALESNRLVIQIQPNEGIQLHFQTKVPDAGMEMRLTDLDFRFDSEFSGSMPEAYERLLLDAAEGDPGLFARSDEVELAWSIIDPIIAGWASKSAPRLYWYETGSWGPKESTDWMYSQGREWFDVCPVLK
ncbi:MAG: glucose-6-phosphate dehydrogenase [Planctomycetales bacterium]|nr:glucose-6-phosphate dehydrogenase [Planctomycetales bacterium]